MTLACQQNSYLRELETKVVACTPLHAGDYNYKYAVTLDDTIIFPEGGGQPEDHGTINGIFVDCVKRRGSQAVHYVQEPLVPGENATVVVDWKRRFDHMQQHTAQHLITAVAEDLLHYSTTSWGLGEDISYVEFDTPSVEKEEIDNLEEALNDKIREGVPVSVHLYEKDAPELLQVRSRLKLPEDHYGPVRVISIDGIDNNTCCGTHVRNISELQTIKLLYAERGNKKNKTHVFFVAGNRVLKQLDQSGTLELLLCNFLNCNPENVLETVQKLHKSWKFTSKNLLLTLRDLAVMEAKLFKLEDRKPLFFSLHKKNADPEFMSIFLHEVNDNSVLFFLTVGDGKTGGQLTLAGPENLVQKYGPQVCEILNGKGSYKNGKYQGKFTKFVNIPKAEDLLRAAVEP